jgi:DNA-binding transcriptional ArsR family regulator
MSKGVLGTFCRWALDLVMIRASCCTCHACTVVTLRFVALGYGRHDTCVTCRHTLLVRVLSSPSSEVNQFVLSKTHRQPALNQSRVRAARANLLGGRAVALIDDIRVVFCEPVRTQIVRALSVGPLTVTELVATTGRGRTAISQHLRVLRQESLVEPDRRGRMMYYALTTGLATHSAVSVLAMVAELAI